MDSSLLQPSLGEQKFKPIYSATAMFAAAFLGGGFAVVIVAGANARRLGRLRRDAVWLLLGLFVAAASGWFALDYFGTDNSRERRVITLGTAFALWVFYHQLHGKMYRAMQTFGTKPPKPYLLLLVAVLVAIGLALLLVTSYLLYHELNP